MTRKSIKVKEVRSGLTRIFRSPREAAYFIGVTDGAIRYAVQNSSICRGWLVEEVPTVYVVRMKDDGNYYVCEKTEGGGGFDMLGEDGGYLQESDVAEVWDVTENFNRVRNGKNEK